MSKKDQSLESGNQADESFADDFSDDFSEDPQDDGSRMSREVKIGLVVIALLISVLGYVVYNQFSGSDDDGSSVAENEPAEDPADDESDPDASSLTGPLDDIHNSGTSQAASPTSSPQFPWRTSGTSTPAAPDLPATGSSHYMAPATSGSYPDYGSSAASDGTTSAAADTSPYATGTGAGYTYGQPDSSPASSGYPASTTAGTGGSPATAAGPGYSATASQGTAMYSPAQTPAGAYPNAQAGQTTESTGAMTPLSSAPNATPSYSAPAADSQGTQNPLRDAYSSAGSAVAAQPAASSPYSSSQPAYGSSQPAYSSSQPAYSSSQPAYSSSQPAYGSGYSTGQAASGASGYSSSGGYSSVAGSADAATAVVEGTYVVQPNDSFASISKKVYGTESYFKALAEYNRAAVLGPNQLKPRQEIETPSIAELEAQCPGLCPTTGHREIVQRRQSVVRTTSQFSGGRTYVAQEGDTLFDIAKFELGKASRWAEIWELNRDVLGDDFDYVSPGLELVLPAEQSTGGTLTQRPGSTGTYR